ncbi:ATP-binding protein [Streptomyces sp. A3M-1-3]|nr:ATP-binding protein [Streptomyces sp. A3M-1-3]
MPADDAESGRGLLLVQALALDWGVAERPYGKTVWAYCAAARDAVRQPGV